MPRACPCHVSVPRAAPGAPRRCHNPASLARAAQVAQQRERPVGALLWALSDWATAATVDRHLMPQPPADPARSPPASGALESA